MSSYKQRSPQISNANNHRPRFHRSAVSFPHTHILILVSIILLLHHQKDSFVCCNEFFQTARDSWANATHQSAAERFCRSSSHRDRLALEHCRTFDRGWLRDSSRASLATLQDSLASAMMASVLIPQPIMPRPSIFPAKDTVRRERIVGNRKRSDAIKNFVHLQVDERSEIRRADNNNNNNNNDDDDDVADNLPVYIYLHCATLPRSRVGVEIAIEIMDHIAKSGLLARATAVFVMILGDPHDFRSLAEYGPKVIFVTEFSAYTSFYEYPTHLLMQKHAYSISMPTNAAVLYLHTKGITRTNEPIVIRWRSAMLHYVIHMHRQCIRLVASGWESTGLFRREKPYKMYAGNYFWASVQRIRSLAPVTSLVWFWRFNAEAWIFTGGSWCKSHTPSLTIKDFYQIVKGGIKQDAWEKLFSTPVSVPLC